AHALSRPADRSLPLKISGFFGGGRDRSARGDRLAVPPVSPLVSGTMIDRAPIHRGSGEPVLLLHPFMMSQNVWKDVAPLIAETGRYEVFAPTMLGHNGGAKGPFFLSSAALADDVERQMDALGWDTAHIVGNSLGGWVAFELERRGRARTVTGIAPAGGWTRWAPTKFEVIAKFVSGMPVLALARLFG